MQESVEEIDAEEAQVSQSLQETFHAGIADLRDLAGVQGFTKTDIHIIFMQSCVRSDHVWNCDLRVLLEHVAHQAIASNILNTLTNVTGPSSFFLT